MKIIISLTLLLTPLLGGQGQTFKHSSRKDTSYINSTADAGVIRHKSGITFIDSYLTRNSDTVLASGYPAISTATPNLSSGTPPRYFLNKNNLMRVRQTGRITKVSFYKSDGVSTAVNVQVWRQDGATYDLISQSNITSLISASAGVKTIKLSTPLICNEGDFVGIGGTFAFSLTGVAGYANNSLRYTTTEASNGNDFAWDSKSALAYILPLRTYQQAPLIVGIGDSEMAGHPAHYSYIEGSLTSSVTNQILYQLRVLDNRFIYQNMGIGSQTTANILARFKTDVIDLKPRYALINGGVNDIAGSVARSTFLGNWESMLDSCDKYSIVPVVMKIFPWTAGTTTQMRIRDDWNDALDSLCQTHNRYIIVDFDGLGQYDATGDLGNLWNIKTSYNSGDNVHLNLDGYTEAARLIYVAIKAKPIGR